mgnify:CR=1 FL=1
MIARSLVLLICFSLTHLMMGAEPFAPKSMTYILQADRLTKTRSNTVEQLAGCGRDLVVTDHVYTSGTGNEWTAVELATIRQGLVAYISIGEAEDYRSYWNAQWDANRDGQPDAGAPAFLNGENPDWEGNYRVRYWGPQWQTIVLSSVDTILQQGLDGIYLDIVDGFETYEYDPKTKDWIDHRLNPDTGQTYR